MQNCHNFRMAVLQYRILPQNLTGRALNDEDRLYYVEVDEIRILSAQNFPERKIELYNVQNHPPAPCKSFGGSIAALMVLIELFELDADEKRSHPAVARNTEHSDGTLLILEFFRRASTFEKPPVYL